MEEDDTKNNDDILTVLLSMGFELEDSQAAVQSGKLTVESAVEWLLLRNSQLNVKAPRTANTCRLYMDSSEVSTGHSENSNAGDLQTDVGGSSSSQLNSPLSQPREEEQKEEKEEEGEDETESIHTRMFVNNKQREMKQKFEEKQRNEAQKKAILEKKQNKSARALVLKQIADDRQQQKLLHSSALTTNVTSTTQTALPSVSPDLTWDDANQSPLTCNVLIRHPNGQSLRNIFDSDKHLQDVWDYATDYFHEMENMCLIQPFPRRDFTKEDATKSLLELGLCPSVALVLKKTDGSQQAFGKQKNLPPYIDFICDATE